MKIQLIALSLCVLASTNLVKVWGTERNVY